MKPQILYSTGLEILVISKGLQVEGTQSSENDQPSPAVFLVLGWSAERST